VSEYAVKELKLEIPKRIHALIKWNDTGNLTEISLGDATQYVNNDRGGIDVGHVLKDAPHAEISRKIARDAGIKLTW
jgi:hypothetical protein